MSDKQMGDIVREAFALAARVMFETETNLSFDEVAEDPEIGEMFLELCLKNLTAIADTAADIVQDSPYTRSDRDVENILHTQQLNASRIEVSLTTATPFVVSHLIKGEDFDDDIAEQMLAKVAIAAATVLSKNTNRSTSDLLETLKSLPDSASAPDEYDLDYIDKQIMMLTVEEQLKKDIQQKQDKDKRNE